MLPYIADSLKNKLTGIIMMSANAQPLQNLIQEQYKYLYKLSPNKELKNEIQKINKQISYLNSNKFDNNSSSNLLPFNLPAPYWLSIIQYNQTNILKKVQTPTLILQGEGDYQVTMKDFNIWKKSCVNSSNVKFKSYPKLNHLYMKNKSIPSPKEYSNPSHVDNNVLNDISEWILNLQ